MTLIDFVYSLATAVAPVLFGQLLQAHRDLARRLAEIEEAREHERALHAQAVLARERAQLAREMHDVVSHQVSLIAVQAGAMQVAAQDPNVKEAARTIRSLSVTTLDELRTMVTLLRASGGNACVELWQDGDHVGVTVANTPPTRPSLSMPGSHQGLVGLQERTDILHSTLEAGPTTEGGYRVRLRIPLSTD